MTQSWKVEASHLPVSRTWPVASCKGCWEIWEMGLVGPPRHFHSPTFGRCRGGCRRPTDAKE